MVATSSTRAPARLTEDELIRGYSRSGSADPAHVPQPHELRNAWESAKQLEDRLELADQRVLSRIARYVREQVFLEHMEPEGYFEVPQQRRPETLVEEVVPDPA
jgi:hypothetical protein